jgi:hypothetical protein
VLEQVQQRLENAVLRRNDDVTVDSHVHQMSLGISRTDLVRVSLAIEPSLTHECLDVTEARSLGL